MRKITISLENEIQMSDGSFSTKYRKLYQYREIYYPLQIVKEGDCSIPNY